MEQAQRRLIRAVEALEARVVPGAGLPGAPGGEEIVRHLDELEKSISSAVKILCETFPEARGERE